MRKNIVGQLFYAGDKEGPFFQITSENIDGPYMGTVVSNVTTNVIERREGFATVAEAVAWCYEYCEY